MSAATPSPDTLPDGGREVWDARSELAALASLIERPPSDDVLLDREVAERAAASIRLLLAANSLPENEEMARAGFEAWARQAGHPLRQTYEEYDDKLTHVAWCAWKAATITPPTDAGSTTREGGEGVRVSRENEAHIRAFAAALFDHKPANGTKRFADAPYETQLRYIDQAWWVLGQALPALATTSSPDASPDSGEIVTDAMRRAGGLAINPDEDVLSVTGHEAELAYRAMRLAASPASLSGGAEARLRTAIQLEVDELSSTDSPFSVGIRKRLLAALHPSPEAPTISTFVRGGESLFEAPANRQGTCTCNGAGQWPLVELEHVPGCPRGPANRQEAGEVERDKLADIADRIRRQAVCLEGYAVQSGHAAKPVPSVFHLQASHFVGLADELAALALTSPKDVKGGEA